jgi:hypothetical protein
MGTDKMVVGPPPLQMGVQLLDMVDNLTNLREPVFGRFFVILLKRQVASSS